MLKNKANKRHEREWLVVFSLFHGSRTRERLGRIKGQPSAKQTNPLPAGKSQGAAMQNPPASWKGSGWPRKNPLPAGKKGSGWPRKNPLPGGKKGSGWPRKTPRLSLQGRRRVKVSARTCKAKKQRTTAKQNYLKPEGGLRQPTTRAEKHTHSETKKVLGFCQDRRRPPSAHHEG